MPDLAAAFQGSSSCRRRRRRRRARARPRGSNSSAPAGAFLQLSSIPRRISAAETLRRPRWPTKPRAAQGDPACRSSPRCSPACVLGVGRPLAAAFGVPATIALMPPRQSRPSGAVELVARAGSSCSASTAPHAASAFPANASSSPSQTPVRSTPALRPRSRRASATPSTGSAVRAACPRSPSCFPRRSARPIPAIAGRSSRPTRAGSSTTPSPPRPSSRRTIDELNVNRLLHELNDPRRPAKLKPSSRRSSRPHFARSSTACVRLWISPLAGLSWIATTWRVWCRVR